MTAPSSRTHGADQGVSVILGAMLLTGILLSTVVVYQVSLAPKFDAAKEATHMRDVARQLAEIKADVDRQVDNRSTGSVATPVPLGLGGSSLLGPSDVTGSLVFEPDTAAARVWVDALRVQRLNGTAVGGTEESWAPVSDGGLEDIVRVESFRLKIAEVSSDHVGDNVTVAVTGVDGEAAGTLTISVTDESGRDRQGGGKGYQVWVTTRDAGGAELYDQAIRTVSSDEEAQAGPISPFWVDTLDGEYRFDRVLWSAHEPYDVNLTSHGLDAEYAITYERSSLQGRTVLVGSGGLVIDGYQRSYDGGRVVFHSANRFFEPQALSLETGGVILEQNEGALFLVEPHLRTGLDGNVVVLSLALPILIGDPSSVTGQGVGTVHTSLVAPATVQAEATNLTLNLTTGHPDLWSSLWRTKLDKAGLSEGPAYNVTTGDGWALLEVWGLTGSSPGDDDWDLILELRQADIEVDLDG